MDTLEANIAHMLRARGVDGDIVHTRAGTEDCRRRMLLPHCVDELEDSLQSWSSSSSSDDEDNKDRGRDRAAAAELQLSRWRTVARRDGAIHTVALFVDFAERSLARDGSMRAERAAASAAAGPKLAVKALTDRVHCAMRQHGAGVRVLALHRLPLGAKLRPEMEQRAAQLGVVQLWSAHAFAHFCLPRHALVPEHALVPAHRVDEELTQRACIGAQRHLLPLLVSSDAMYRYLDARPGDVVRVHRESPFNGRELVYRLAVQDASAGALKRAVAAAAAAAAAPPPPMVGTKRAAAPPPPQ